MTHVTCRLIAKNRDQLRNPTLGNRVWATFTLTTNRTNHISFRLHSFSLVTLPLIALQSIVMTLSVCLSVILSVELHVQSLPNFLCVLDDITYVDVVIRCVLPVLWMMSRLRILPRNRRCHSELIRSSIDLSPWHILKLIHQGQHRTLDRFWYLRLPCFFCYNWLWSRDSWFTATWDRIIFLLEDLVLYFRITTCIWINVFV